VITNELAPVLYAILVRDHLKILNWESKTPADSATPPHDWRGADGTGPRSLAALPTVPWTTPFPWWGYLSAACHPPLSAG